MPTASSARSRGVRPTTPSVSRDTAPGVPTLTRAAARALHMHTRAYQHFRDILKPMVARSCHSPATTSGVRCPMHNALTSTFASGRGGGSAPDAAFIGAFYWDLLTPCDAALCRVARWTWPVRCGFAIGSRNERRLHRAALRSPMQLPYSKSVPEDGFGHRCAWPGGRASRCCHGRDSPSASRPRQATLRPLPLPATRSRSSPGTGSMLALADDDAQDMTAGDVARDPAGRARDWPSETDQAHGPTRPGGNAGVLAEHHLEMSPGDKDALDRRTDLKPPCQQLIGRTTSDDALRPRSAPGQGPDRLLAPFSSWKRGPVRPTGCRNTPAQDGDIDVRAQAGLCGSEHPVRTVGDHDPAQPLHQGTPS
jgi:hypothetical protein